MTDTTPTSALSDEQIRCELCKGVGSIGTPGQRCFACDGAGRSKFAAPTPAQEPKRAKLERSISSWEKCDPHAMAKMSESAVYFALRDARHDILALAAPQPAPDARAAVIEECCAAIKAEDDKQSENDYMLDSNDCIAVLRALIGTPGSQAK